jgi:hypothetical protein
MQKYTIGNVLVITKEHDESYIYGVFSSMNQVHDYIENEISDIKTNVVPWSAVIEISSNRVWLLDKRFEPYQMEDYSSEPTRRRRALQQQAFAKLTPEECEALGFHHVPHKTLGL